MAAGTDGGIARSMSNIVGELAALLKQGEQAGVSGRPIRSSRK